MLELLAVGTVGFVLGMWVQHDDNDKKQSVAKKDLLQDVVNCEQEERKSQQQLEELIKYGM